MDRRQPPPRARVDDIVTPGAASDQPHGSRVSSTRARIHIALASAMIFGYAAYILRWIILTRAWVWLIAVAILALAGGFLLWRKPWARHLVLGSVIIYVGTWLISSVVAVVNVWKTEPWLVDVLMFVPGIALVVVPSLYCVRVARTYIDRS